MTPQEKQLAQAFSALAGTPLEPSTCGSCDYFEDDGSLQHQCADCALSDAMRGYLLLVNNPDWPARPLGFLERAMRNSVNEITRSVLARVHNAPQPQSGPGAPMSAAKMPRNIRWFGAMYAVEIHKAKDGHRWRAWSKNGHVVAESGEAYLRRSDCTKLLCRLFGGAAVIVLP